MGKSNIIRSLEYKKMSKQLTKLISKANHRYDRMTRAGWKSPAMDVAKKTGGRFRNGRKMSFREMQREYKRVNNFLNSKTSSKTGTKKTVNKMLKSTGLDKKFKTSDVMHDQRTLDKYFSVYKRVQEYDQIKGVGRSYQSTMNAVTSTFESYDGIGSVDDMLDHVNKALDEPREDNWDSDETFKHIIG